MDCPVCRGAGQWFLSECPHKFIAADRWLWDVVLAAEQAEKGLWPMSGGWLEQADSLVQAVQVFWSCSHGR